MPNHESYFVDPTDLKKPPWLLFHLFSSFLSTVQKNSGACWIRTWIFVVENKEADHYNYTITTALVDTKLFHRSDCHTQNKDADHYTTTPGLVDPTQILSQVRLSNL